MTSMITEEWLAAQTPEVQAVIRHLLAKIERLNGQIGKLTPQNSSLPPSTQHPHAKPPRRKRKSKRKRGGQEGHPKHERTLVPTAQCNEVVDLYPEACRGCSTALQGQDDDPLRHQVWELPKIEPHITEYRQHRLTCPCCGETTCAVLPTGVPTGQSGPRLVAFTGLLMGHFRQSKRRAALFLQDLLGFPCSPGLTVKMQNQVAAALEHDLMRQVKVMFIHWKRYKAGEISWRTFQVYMRPIRQEVNALLLRGAFSGNRRLMGMCDELWRHREWLWTFVDVQGIEPTNNNAERALRPAVIYRKLSFGTQSEAGSRFIERMLTACETCRLQQRSIFNYLVAAVESHFAGTSAPSLVPSL